MRARSKCLDHFLELVPETIPRLKREKTLPQVLSRGELAALFGRVDSPRYRAILMLMYDAGLRTREAVSMRPEDLRAISSPKDTLEDDRA